MKIARIEQISNVRAFKSFQWKKEWKDFGTHVLFYGWNGSGKTTLSMIFRNIELRKELTEGKATIHVVQDATPAPLVILVEKLSQAVQIPTIRVLNRDAIDAGFLQTGSLAKPIFVLGKESVEQQRQLEEIRKQIAQVVHDLDGASKEVVAAETALDKFEREQAAMIKTVLQPTAYATNRHKNYSKAVFRPAISVLSAESASTSLLGAVARNVAERQRTSVARTTITSVRDAAIDVDDVEAKGTALLNQDVVAKTIDTLTQNSALANWVSAGLQLHDADATNCEFCEQPLPSGRLDVLRDHFNEEMTTYVADLQRLANVVREASRRSITLPDSGLFHDDLASPAKAAADEISSICVERSKWMESWADALEARARSPFAAVPPPLQTKPDIAKINTTIAQLNELTKEHNTRNESIVETQRLACDKIEASMVGEAFPEWKLRTDLLQASTERAKVLKTKCSALEKDSVSIEREIVHHRQPADDLNVDLRQFFGRDELQLTVEETGYRITRRGQTALNLSEGEKSGIAFLYFLRQLTDKSIGDLSKAVVVIDDPITSMDSNALYMTMAFLQKRLENVGQVIIFTHNFPFYRQVDAWFENEKTHANKKKRKVEISRFMTQAVNRNGERESEFVLMNSPHGDSITEYHYLFSRVLGIAESASTGAGMDAPDSAANEARRLLEAFLNFRYPHKRHRLHQAVSETNVDPITRALLYKFVNDFSHGYRIAESGAEPTPANESVAVLKAVLTLIETEDKVHYDGMVELCRP